MKCPSCSFICSDLRDLCPKCFLDLRPLKKKAGLPLTEPSLSYEELLALESQRRPAGPTAAGTLSRWGQKIATFFKPSAAPVKEAAQPSAADKQSSSAASGTVWGTAAAEPEEEAVTSAELITLVEMAAAPVEVPPIPELSIALEDSAAEPLILAAEEISPAAEPPTLPEEEVISAEQPLILLEEEAVPIMELLNLPREETVPAAEPQTWPEEEIVSAEQPLILPEEEDVPIKELLNLPREETVPAAEPPTWPEEEVVSAEQPLILLEEEAVSVAALIADTMEHLPESAAAVIEAEETAPEAAAEPMETATAERPGPESPPPEPLPPPAELEADFQQTLAEVVAAGYTKSFEISLDAANTKLQDETVQLLFDLSREAISNPEIEKSYADLSARGIAQLEAKELQAALRKTEAALSRPLMSLKSSHIWSKGAPATKVEEPVYRRAEDLVPADRGSLILSGLVDAIAIIVVSFFLSYLHLLIVRSSPEVSLININYLANSEILLIQGSLLAALCLATLLYPLLALLLVGQTIGQRLVGLMPLRISGRLLDREAIFIRCLSFPLTALLTLQVPLLLGRRPLYDYLAGVIVVEED